MMQLIIQTCIEPLELAIVSDEKIIAKEQVIFPVASSLFTSIDSLLKKSKLKKTDLNEIGFVKGPGSFTGLRTGYSFAKALSRALKIPLKGIGVFETFLEDSKKQDVFVAYKRTKKDAFVANITNGKVNFFSKPITFVDVKKLLANYENSLIYGNIFSDFTEIKPLAESLDIMKIVKNLKNKKASDFSLIYGNTCYAKPLYSQVE